MHAEYAGLNNGAHQFVTTQFSPGYPPGSPACSPGAPYPCPPPIMHPQKPGIIFGAQMPEAGMRACECSTFEEAVKRLCYVGASLYVPAVPAGGVVVWTQSVKWWWQAQHITNLGDQTNRSFRLTNIKYGKGEFQLDFKTQTATVNGAAVTLGTTGIDIRRWNNDAFVNKSYPFPASALEDEVYLTFVNVSAGNATLDLDFGGPALLQQ